MQVFHTNGSAKKPIEYDDLGSKCTASGQLLISRVSGH
jgi:hypothetical protein